MLIEDIKKSVLNQTEEAVLKVFDKKIDGLTLVYPPDIHLGDFALECFSLTKELKMPAEEIAKKIAATISATNILQEIKAVGPYLNFTLNKQFLFKEVLAEILSKKENFGDLTIGKEEKIIVEYLSPNTNKPLHLGHLRNGAIGMAIARLLESVGYQIIKANLINDRGVHICQSMIAWQKWANGATPKSTAKKGDHFVGDWYVKYHEAAAKNPELGKQLEKEVQVVLKKWEAGDPEIVNLWKTMNEWVYQGFEQTYKELGLEFDVFNYESETYKLGKEIIEDGLQKGIFKKAEDGAVIVKLPNNIKITLLRADGTSVYITQDLGTAKLRFDKYHPDKLIYVVAAEQNFYFQTLFKIFDILGFDWQKKCFHFSYGLVKLPEGKMKSREGKVVDADDLIEEMKILARQEIKKRYQKKALSEKEINDRAKKIALAAIKFYLLKVKASQEINFNPKESISFEGFTGPYIQYAYARASGILEKAAASGLLPEIKNADFSILAKEEELFLLRHLIQFPEKIKTAAEYFDLSIIASHLYATAKAFNQFYTTSLVLLAGNEELVQARLILVKTTAITIKKGLRLLGIEGLEKM